MKYKIISKALARDNIVHTRDTQEEAIALAETIIKAQCRRHGLRLEDVKPGESCIFSRSHPSAPFGVEVHEIE